MADADAEVEIMITILNAKDAERDMASVQGKFDETAKKSGKSGTDMTKFAKKFGGALAIILGGMSATAMALLTQVPVISEIFDALGAIIELLAYMLDSQLRPAMEPIVDKLYDIADSFDALPGPVKQFLTIMILVTAALVLIGVVVVALIIAGSTIALIILAVAGCLAVLVLNIGWVIALAMLLYYTWVDDWVGIRTTVEDAVSAILDVFRDFIRWIDDNFGDELALLADELGETVGVWVDLISDGMALIMFFVGEAIDFIVGLWEGDFLGIRSTVEDVMEGIQTVIENVIAIIEPLVTAWVENIINSIRLVLALLRGDWSLAWELAQGIVTTALDGITGALEVIVDLLKAQAQAAIDIVNSAIDKINTLSWSVPDWVPGIGGSTFSPSIDSIPSLRSEGIVTKTGVAEIHAGEGVFAMESMKQALIEALSESGGGGTGGPIIVQIDGRTVAEAVWRSSNRYVSDRGVLQ